MKGSTSRRKLRVGFMASLLTLSLASFGIQSAHAVTELRFAALAGIDGNFKSAALTLVFHKVSAGSRSSGGQMESIKN